MERFGKHPVLRRIAGEVREIRSLHITTYAGYAGYFIILSLFPALVLMLGFLRYTPLVPEDLMGLLEGFLPPSLAGQAWGLLLDAYENSSRTVISLSALAAVWSAGKGIYGLMKGLNAIYGATEHRGWLRTRLLCGVYLVFFLLVLLLTLALHVFGNTLVIFLRYRGGRLAALAGELMGLRYFLLVAVQTLLFAAAFMYLPDRNNRFWDSLPGALFASFGWMTVSGFFGSYVEHFSGYARIFGPVYTVAVAMLWLYICVNTLFFGGVLNRYLMKIK